MAHAGTQISSSSQSIAGLRAASPKSSLSSYSSEKGDDVSSSMPDRDQASRDVWEGRSFVEMLEGCWPRRAVLPSGLRPTDWESCAAEGIAELSGLIAAGRAHPLM